MQTKKLGFEDSLQKDVVDQCRCVGCAACTVVCPFTCLEYADGTPRLVKACENCGICPRVCPTYDWSWPQAEEFVFGMRREERQGFGIFRRLIVARAADRRVLEKCQDGGAVTAVLAYALQNGIVEGAAISGRSATRPLYPEPKLATTVEEVVENAGTRYAYSPNLLAFQEGVKQGMKSLAFVGTPCQIHAVRKMQMFPLKKYANPLKLAVGLMCTESFVYEGLLEEHIRGKLGIDLSDVVKMNIKGKILVRLASGDETSIPLAEAKQYTRNSCRTCSDFSAELADISAGGLGLNGWTFIILRTELGEQIFNDVVDAHMLKTREIGEEPLAYSLLTKLSRKKMQNTPRR